MQSVLSHNPSLGVGSNEDRTPNARVLSSFLPTLAVVAGWLLLAVPLFAQDLPPAPEPGVAPTVLPVLPAPFWGSIALPPVPRQPPVHLFLMQPAFLYSPLGLDGDDDPSDPPADLTAPPDPDADLAAPCKYRSATTIRSLISRRRTAQAGWATSSYTRNTS